MSRGSIFWKKLLVLNMICGGAGMAPVEKVEDGIKVVDSLRDKVKKRFRFL